MSGQRYESFAVLWLAAGLDFWIGDPKTWLHPVQVMGWIIADYCQFVLKHLKSSGSLRGAGVLLGTGMVVGSGVLGWEIVRLAQQLHPVLGWTIEIILLASCFAGRSLRHAAAEVLHPFQTGDLITAKTRLSGYVGRDTANLTEAEVLRAVFETVTENATDGVTAPLFYALLGTALLPMGSVAFALAYKAASTLDSTIGYREAPYTHLGWFSARLDDCLTWVPCRLTVLTLALLSGKPRHVWRICQRDAPQDPSPNSGWSECAYAATLGVQVGGTNWYRGVAKQKPLLGDPVQPITVHSIQQAMQLTRQVFLLWLGGGTIVLITFSGLGV
ncbi:MAG: adenosylcobinamide-phosphate synthase CbiB [Scytolyngbya sp. HA4215-MV1]|nr:adenosylcobinamide-phosphate synthase CbiB [Scytolyngbya sp. HA4215-MV1]